MTYELTDLDGNRLKIESHVTPGTCRIEADDPLAGERVCLVVPGHDLPEVAAQIVRAMYDAAARRAPIILGHPGPLASGLGDALGDGIRVGRSEGAVLLAVRGVSEACTPALARQVAAHLAARADEADAEPDRKLVSALAGVICEHGGAEGAARAILARYKLEERAA